MVARNNEDGCRPAVFDPCRYAVVLMPRQWTFDGLFMFFFGYPGFFLPWNVIYFTICVATFRFTNPSLDASSPSSSMWNTILHLYVRNLILLWIFSGGWHYLLYQRRVNGIDGKFNPIFPADNENDSNVNEDDKNDKKRKKKWGVFRCQIYDNVFWSCISGVTVWSAYEAVFLRAKAMGLLSLVCTDWYENPTFLPIQLPRGCWSVFVLLVIPFWREFHFYWTHRLLHWRPLYRMIHYLHHKNVNPGPWSGLSMHPIEHLLYFSVVFPHFWIPNHPIHFFFNTQHTALTPASGHLGYQGPLKKLRGTPMEHAGSYFHYLHHRYFDCNYGEATIPLDLWFGTFRDGSTPSSQATGFVAGWAGTCLVAVMGTCLGLLPLVAIANLFVGK